MRSLWESWELALSIRGIYAGPMFIWWAQSPSAPSVLSRGVLNTVQQQCKHMRCGIFYLGLCRGQGEQGSVPGSWGLPRDLGAA